MRVILCADVKGQGKKDQIVEVSDGYARNFLFPKKLAIPADSKAINDVKNKEAAKQHKVDVEIQQAKDLAKKLESIVVVFEYAAGPDKKLYGSVTAKDIAEELKKKHGIDIDKRKITLAEPIKSFGEFKADVKLYSEVSGKINVLVTSKKQ
ncbi:MAG: 50S ribosomal protein L9 [Clostridia bacterium]|jgi:large subunit ribosomal protein L9|nr:50S ribosomal protein L9 [Clostridia bacterium]